MFKKPNEYESTPNQTASAPPAREQTGGTTPAASPNRVRERRQSVLSPSMAIKGDISGTEDLILEGKMEGTINLPKNEVHIGPDGQVKADLTAMKVSIEGRVTGDIRGSERVVIKHSGKVEGNIVAPRVVLEDGCQFKGSVEMNTSGAVTGNSTKSQDPKPTQDSSRQKADAGSNHGSNAKVNQYASESRSRASSTN